MEERGGVIKVIFTSTSTISDCYGLCWDTVSTSSIFLYCIVTAEPEKMADNDQCGGRGAIFSLGPVYEPFMLWKQTDGGCSSPAQSLQGAMAADVIGLM